MINRLTALLPALAICLAAVAQPAPREVVPTGGSCTLPSRFTVVAADKSLAPVADYANDLLCSGRGGHKVILSLGCKSVTEPEGYEIEITRRGVRIAGVDYAGAFNGMQQLLRMLPPAVYAGKGLQGKVSLDCCTVADWPEMHYRGIMLDVARTWVPLEQIYRLVDNLAYQNLNVLHLHLCDDEAWRIEILSHPELAKVGGFRSPDGALKPIYGKYDETFGGYYTQEELKGLVSYAAQRNITIVPEIDLPGHSRAIASVMPEILCDWQSDTSRTAGLDFRGVWCVSKESNYKLLEDIFTEVCDIFPSPYIHIGGDEVGMNNWLSCPLCQKTMEDNGFTDAHQLEDMFMKRVTSMIKAHGRTPVGWWDEDVIKDNFPEGSILYGWQSFPSCVNALSKGHRTVILPAHYLYFDMHQSEPEDGNIWAGAVDYDKVLSIREELVSLNDTLRSGVFGMMGALWGETCPSHNPETPDYQDLMLFPRALALARVSWNPALPPVPAAHSAEALTAMGINFWKGPAQAEKGPFLKPEVTITSSLDEDTSFPFAKAASYEGVAYTGNSPKNGDWVLYEFAEPLTCSEIVVRTGFVEFPSGVIAKGRVYASEDGENFAPVADFFNGAASFRPQRPVKALKAVSERHGNGFYKLVVQPLKIYE